MSADQKHECDADCVCPIHGTPLLYWPSGDDHACQDSECCHAHGLVIEPLDWAKLRIEAT